MKLHQLWKDELLALVNEKNQLTLKESDVKFELVSRDESTGAVSVKVSPGDVSPYFNAQSLTYVPRDIAKNFVGLPLRFIVSGDTTMRALVQSVANRFGISLDETVDFLQADLDKAVTFEDAGNKTVEVDVASTSFVWVGKLQINVANDTLDLVTIIANADLTQLKYLSTEDGKGSLDLATWPIQHDVDGLPMQTGLTNISKAIVSALLANMVKDGSVKQEDSDAILAATMLDANDEMPFNVMVDDTVEPNGFISVLFSNSGGKFSTPNFEGAAWIRYPNKVPPIRYVMKTDGGTVNLTLTGWTDIKVDWGDGSPVETEGTAFSHTYADTTSRTIVASGTVSNQYGKQVIRGFNITEFVEWNNGLFYCPETNNCQKLVKVPNSIPPTWTSLEKLFAYASIFNGPEVLQWDTSNIFSMASTFTGASKFNQPIGIWNVSKVTDMDFMFGTAYQFNQPLNDWDVSKVTDFSFMFSSANAFNQPLDQWNMSSARTLAAMFSSAQTFNGDISTWDVSGVTTMANMFSGAVAFNVDISQWQTSSLKQIDYFMRNNKIFDQDLSGWDVSKITSGLTTMADGTTAWQESHRPGYVAPITSKFVLATLAAGDIKISVQTLAGDAAPWYKLSDGVKRSFTDGMFATNTVTEAGRLEIGWNEASTDVRVSVQGTAIVSIDQFDTLGTTTQYDFQRSPNLVKVPAVLPANVLRTSSMFYYCSSFNGAEVVNWDVSHVTSMGQMFQNATSFNQDLSAWNTAAVTNNTWFADGATAWEAAKQPSFPGVSA